MERLFVRFRLVSFAFEEQTKRRRTSGKVRYITLLVGRDGLCVQLSVRPVTLLLRVPNSRSSPEGSKAVARVPKGHIICMEKRISYNMSSLVTGSFALREHFILVQESASVLSGPESAVSAD